MTYRFSNNAKTTLGSSISPTDTTITVATGTGAKFPALVSGQFFTATLFASATGLPNEIVRVTGRVGDTMTVVRGQEGTTAQAWSVGDVFDNFLTAGFLNQLVDSSAIQQQPGNFAADTGTANAGAIALNPVPVNYAALLGVPIRVEKIGVANTGEYTLNVNALGPVPVLVGNLAFSGGELAGSEVFEVIFNGSVFNLISNTTQINGNRLLANSVANAELAQMASDTIKGNLGGGTATPYDVPIAALAALLVNAAGVLGRPGYFTIPVNVGGSVQNLIVQWGQYSFVTESAIAVPYPIPFPTAIFIFDPGLIQTNNSSNQNNLSLEGITYGLTQFSAHAYAGGNHNNYTMNWIAIGV
jgi:hypothetical protein